MKLSGDSSNTTGQLLAEMERVAGDLASMYLQDAAVPDEKKEFQYIELFGFVRFCNVELQGIQAGNGFL